MRLVAFFAWRYLFSKKSVNAINLISIIAALGVMVSSAALVIILSVFNGLSDFALKTLDVVTPELKVEPIKGKTFNPKEVLSFLSQQKNISYSEVLQDKALMRYKNLQFVGSIKGLRQNYLKKKMPAQYIQEGALYLGTAQDPYAIIGATVRSYLHASTEDVYAALEIYSPRKDVENSINPLDEFTIKNMQIAGVFQPSEYLNELAVMPLETAQELLNESENCSFIEISTSSEEQTEILQHKLSAMFGKKLSVKNKMEQNELIFKLFNTEKWSVYLILCFILIIAICNIIGSLSMLVIDKQKDISILASMGADKKLIKNIFFYEGVLIMLLGSIVGLSIGYGFCVVQEKYSLISFGSEITLLKSYPVKMLWSDFFKIVLTILTISLPTNWLASRLSVRDFNKAKKI